MIVRELRPEDRESYRRYWQSSPRTHFFQRLEWDEIFNKIYGYRPRHILALSEGGEVQGILPLYEVKSLVFGHSLKSMPFHAEGGMSADNAEIEAALFQAALDMSRESGVSLFDLKHRELTPWAESAPQGWGHGEVRYDRYVLDLASRDEDEIFASFKQDVRNAVRKATKNGIRISISQDREDLKRFHLLMLIFSAESGLPCHPYAFFEALFETFIARGEGGISLAWSEGRPIAGKMFFMDQTKSTAIQNWSAIRHSHRKLKANSLILWEEIRHCRREGMRSFDFGVTNSAHTASAFFKSRWNTKASPVFFHQFLPNGGCKKRDDHAGFGLAKRLWRLLPTPAIDLLSRGLMRHLA